MYLAHDMTIAQGGHVIGIFADYNKAKNTLKELCRWEEKTTDWGHFIRWFEPDKPFLNVWFLPRTNKDGTPDFNKPKSKGYILGVPVVDGQVVF